MLVFMAVQMTDHKFRAREMTQKVGALVALPGNLDTALSAHMVVHNCPVPGDLTSSSSL